MNELKLQYYKVAFISVKRSAAHGVYNNAKPVLLLSIIDKIEDGTIKDNFIPFSEELNAEYKKKQSLSAKAGHTSMIYPYYYLHSDGFYHLEGVKKELEYIKTPNTKYLRENVKYARFDNALWDLLQDTECRQTLHEVIIQNFLT